MVERFDKFTERARRVISFAEEEARRLSHNYIGTEHLLLGIVREGDGLAAKVLVNLGVELPQIRELVGTMLHPGDSTEQFNGLTPRAKKAIELAIDEVKRLNHHFIGTEHLLLGISREGEGGGAMVLESLNINLEKIREETTRILTQSGPQANLSSRSLAERARTMSIINEWVNFISDPSVEQTKKDQYLQKLTDLLKEAKEGNISQSN